MSGKANLNEANPKYGKSSQQGEKIGAFAFVVYIYIYIHR